MVRATFRLTSGFAIKVPIPMASAFFCVMRSLNPVQRMIGISGLIFSDCKRNFQWNRTAALPGDVSNRLWMWLASFVGSAMVL